LLFAAFLWSEFRSVLYFSFGRLEEAGKPEAVVLHPLNGQTGNQQLDRWRRIAINRCVH
jgi:hypothetical protein